MIATDYVVSAYREAKGRALIAATLMYILFAMQILYVPFSLNISSLLPIDISRDALSNWQQQEVDRACKHVRGGLLMSWDFKYKLENGTASEKLCLHRVMEKLDRERTLYNWGAIALSLIVLGYLIRYVMLRKAVERTDFFRGESFASIKVVEYYFPKYFCFFPSYLACVIVILAVLGLGTSTADLLNW